MDAPEADPGPEPADPFVGRSRELAALSSALRHVRAGEPQVVSVEGPAGIGKTALVRHFLATTSDVTALSANADEWESRLPFGVVGQLLRPMDRRHKQWADDLAELGAPNGPVPDPLTVGAKLVGLLADAAVRRPLAVVLDDMQWADVASLQAITFAFRRFRGDAVLGIVICPDGVAELSEGLGRLTVERGFRLQLARLEPQELGDLAQRITKRRLSGPAVKRLWEHTDGNPAAARTLLGELGADVIEQAQGPLPAPRSLSRLTLARVATCGEPARRLIEAVAVVGQRCPLSLAARIAGLDAVEAAFEEAVHKDLLENNPLGPGLVRFVLPLSRAAVYHHLGPARKSALHLAAAELTPHPASLDHRIAAALGEDQSVADKAADQARREAARGAVSVASAYFLAAARLSPSAVDREEYTRDAIEALLDGGEVAAAARAADGFGTFGPTARARYVCGRLALMQGRAAEAERLLVDAWKRCRPDVEPDLCSRIGAQMAQLCGAQLRSDDAAEWAERAIDASEDAEVTASALGVLVPCLGMVGRAREGLGVALAVAPGGSGLSVVDTEALLGRGIVRLWLDDLADARRDLLAVLDACVDRPASRPALLALGTLGDVEYRMGAWDNSASHASRAVSLMEDSDQRWLAAFLYSAATWVAAPRGDWVRADACADAALAAAQAMGDPLSVFCASAARAHVAFFKGDHAVVAEALQPLFERGHGGVPEEPGVHAWRHLHAESLLRLGRTSDAASAIAALERLAAAPDRRSTRAYLVRLQAVRAETSGDPEQAAATFAAAAQHFEDLSMIFEAALAHDGSGRQFRQTGDRREAAGHLRRAVDVYRRLGTEPLAARAERELALCGVQPHGGARHASALTPQELTVAMEVSRGRSNRETAQELVISVKTVEHHLRSIYAKLGVRSRTELAARLRDTGQESHP